MDVLEKIGKIKLEVVAPGAIESIVALQKEITILTKKKAELKNTTALDRKLNAEYSETIKFLKKDLNAYSKEVQQAIIAYTQKTESINQLRSQLANLQATYNNLSGEERKLASNQKLKLSIRELATTIEQEQAALSAATTAEAKAALTTDVLTKAKVTSKVTTDAEAGAFVALKLRADQAAMSALNLGAAYGMTDGRFIAAKNKAQQLEAELHRLNQTVGKVGRGANNANYSIFTLTQVMRELPNFAIDARTGFMSLSNNLPMLTQGFQDLTAKLGSSRAAFKMMMGSLLSLNTLMVFASTLMVMFGDDITTALKKKLLDLDEAQQALNKTLKDGNSEYGTAVKKTYEANEALEEYKLGNLSAEEALKLVNAQMEGQINAFKDIDAAIAWFAGENTDAYLKAMYAQGLANIYLQTAVNNRAKADRMAANELITNAQVVGKSFSLLWNYIANPSRNVFKKGPSWFGIPQLIKDMGNAEKLILEGRDSTAAKLRAKSDEDRAIYEAEMKKSFEGLKGIKNPVNTSLEGSIDALKKKLKTLQATYKALSAEERSSVKGQNMKASILEVTAAIKKEEDALKLLKETGSDSTATVYELRKEYEGLADTLKLVQEELKDTAAEEERFGVKTPYETRTAAANTWYDNEVKIVAAEKVLQDNKIADEYAKDKESIKGKIGYAAAVIVLDKNREDALLKNKSEYINAEKEAERQRKTWLYTIGQDRLKERRDEIKAAETDTLAGYETERAAAIATADAKYRLAISEVRTTRDKSIVKKKQIEELARIDAFYDAMILDEKRKTLQTLANLETTSDADRLKLKEDLKDLELAIEKDKNAKLLEGNKVANDTLEEQDRQSLETRQAILQEALNMSQDLLASYYDYLGQEIENQKNQELAALEEKHAKRQISDTAYEKKKEQINKAAFEKDKQLKIKQAWMEWALGLVRIWSQSGINAVLGAAMSVALTATTGANVAVIKKQKYASRGLVLDGPSHAQGGIPVEAEGGEAIINKRSTSMFRPLLSVINQAGGGVKFAGGGMPGLRNDGGYAMRAISQSAETGLTERQLRLIVSSIKVYTTISDIHKADRNYVTIENNGKF